MFINTCILLHTNKIEDIRNFILWLARWLHYGGQWGPTGTSLDHWRSWTDYEWLALIVTELDQANGYDTVVPVNLKDKDEFHLTIEEYLQALISLVDELVWTSLIPHNALLQLNDT